VRIESILWLEEILEKLWRKHGVEEHEVVEVLQSRPKFRFVEKGNREGEDVYVAAGRTDPGRLLLVFFVLKQSGEALILSARDMSPSERRRYEQK
jgi:uncharacterized DUF497 family protein